MIIKGVIALIVLDSRKQETIEVSVNGQVTKAPAGKSTGKYEAKSYIKDVEGDVKALNSLKLNVEINNFDDLAKIEKVVEGKIGAEDKNIALRAGWDGASKKGKGCFNYGAGISYKNINFNFAYTARGVGWAEVSFKF